MLHSYDISKQITFQVKLPQSNYGSWSERERGGKDAMGFGFHVKWIVTTNYRARVTLRK